ncbi:hypothetical protein NsoK4_02110 [Nitrosopumilus sp. K4]|uniref:hypothetical protein n=1 Tax=Nitrosopumilus sp. K4 TaxID=2795383 RepID=UPI001BA73C7A|nr:hypothetical protein [Nitrosopumilus sp. K4]QUC65084.1 hypothetical protein NsoK4_02110 [Nitrosopumilus sp. K4]
MDLNQAKFEFESSKENLLKAILKNRESLDTESVSVAIKEYLRNHDKYKYEKNKIFEILSKS